MMEPRLPAGTAANFGRNRARTIYRRQGRSPVSGNAQRASVPPAAPIRGGRAIDARSNARIVHPKGVLVMQLTTPYDSEQFFEHIAWDVARHGRIRVRVDRGEWVVTLTQGRAEVCAGCGRQPDRVAFARNRRTLCAPCVRQELS